MSIQINERTLRLGDRGDDVLRLQNSLNDLEDSHVGTVTVDGIFGNGTKAAVMRYQSSRGLTADGIVGPNTWARIIHERM